MEHGDLARAAEMLGREYTILGTVKRGAQLGRQLGFPTANLSAHSEQFPPNGVYVCGSATRRARCSAASRISACGRRSAADNPERLLELHLFDLDRDIYGQDVEVRFTRYLRAEQKFDSLDELKAQIARDVEAARALAL